MKRTLVTVAGLLLASLAAGPGAVAQEADQGWPREIEAGGHRIIMYQPQLEGFDGNHLKARAAVSVTPSGKTEPTFGTVWIKARTLTDRDDRVVTLADVDIPQVRFPDAEPEQEKQLAALFEREIPTWSLAMSLDRLLTMLDLAERERVASEGFNNDPPTIVVVDTPTVLVLLDGEPKLQKIENTRFEHVVNTAFVIIHDPKSKTFYLSAGADTWYTARAATGPWTVARSVPREISDLVKEEEPEEVPEGADEGPSTPPAILVATEPTELIVTDGQPEYSPMPGGELLYVNNTDSDVLMEIESQRHFVLLSGRWYAGRGLGGPWEYIAADELPPSFQDIPSDSDELAHLRTWVDGTQEAKEAVLDAHVPQTAAIKRDATIEVTYDGKPKFEDVEETKLQYAVNTPDQVLKYGKKYYCVKEAVWYTADDPEGPWRVATEVPDEVQKIPASNPNYNVKYVHVYDVTPTVVYVGYYPGYTHSYVYGGTIVYGTGWWYRPWWGAVYYPRPATWGFHVRWNPWSGWGFGFSYSTGRFTFSIGFGGWGGWYRGGWWGPRPIPRHPYARGWHRGWHHGYRAGARAGARAGYRTAQRQNMYRAANNRARVAAQPRVRPATGAQPRPTDRPNNVVSDRSGNVHQRTQSGNWQSRAGTTATSTRSLDRTQASRQRGATRTQSFNRAGGARPRAGGGRRR
jgi:hypothetical protein